jgi:hypothetical protein
MPKTPGPVELLRKLRGHFAKEAENYETAKHKAGTVWERNVAEEFSKTAQRFVSEIDATLRDWA